MFMKNYLSRRNERGDNFVDIWNDPFEDFFKPFFYGENRHGSMKTVSFSVGRAIPRR